METFILDDNTQEKLMHQKQVTYISYLIMNEMLRHNGALKNIGKTQNIKQNEIPIGVKYEKLSSYIERYLNSLFEYLL